MFHANHLCIWRVTWQTCAGLCTSANLFEALHTFAPLRFQCHPSISQPRSEQGIARTSCTRHASGPSLRSMKLLHLYTKHAKNRILGHGIITPLASKHQCADAPQDLHAYAHRPPHTTQRGAKKICVFV